MSAETSMSMIEPVNNTVVISSDCSFGLKKDVQEQVSMKKCGKCGRTLPTTEFNKSKASKDGLQYHCRSCHREEMRKCHIMRAERELGKKSPVHQQEPNTSTLTKVYAHPELAKFQPRQLMEELKARGFKWEYMLEPQKKIYFDKI